MSQRGAAVGTLLAHLAAGGMVLASIAATGCATHRAPRSLEAALEQQLGCRLEPEEGFKLGWASTRIISGIAGEDEGGDGLRLKDLTGLDVAVYNRECGSPAGGDAAGGEKSDGADRHADLGRLVPRGWETILRVRDTDGQILVAARTDRSGVRGAMFVSIDDDEVVIARLRGRLNRLIEALMRGSEENGSSGARRALPLGAGGGRTSAALAKPDSGSP